ncbi:MAG TPA: FHA domain-containing protein [Planctomycetaceae bacterium]|jgi:ABC-type multidrug transport system ATPase subunit/ABC-type multidrug transport system permease subunit|nr:FHA domain-containing protein [Planctomycetaceae bacterium]
MRVAYRVTLPNGRTKTLRAEGATIRLGRDASCEITVDPVANPTVSGLHARIGGSDGAFVLIHVSRSNKTLLNDAVVETTSPVKAGDRIKLGYTGPTIELLSIEAAALAPVAAPDGSGRTVQADARHLALLRGTQGTKRIDIGKGGVIGRDSQSQFQLDHPHVSRSHAGLAVDGDLAAIADLGSSNGTFVNGRRLTKPARLQPGDRIDIGPFSLQFDGTGLVSRSRSNNIELSASGVKRIVEERTTGTPLTILDDVTLVIRPREFVCLLGPSGSGKSTLLAILSGRSEPQEGVVAVNGEDLYADFEAIKGDIAVVPQKDVLHDSLAVGAALRYTAELRLPPDTSRDEIESSVSDILNAVGLSDRRSTLIRHLSGGQVKRASLANELMSRPSLLFLDEVTSGLDEQTDREVMELFRRVADGGKTVVCATHSLANVEETCHLVVILTKGGRLAFVGTPDEAKEYFDIRRLGDVYARLAERKPQDWHARFRASPHFQRYVADRIPVEKFGEARSITEITHPKPSGASLLRQTSILIRRYASILRGDPQALLATLGQGLLIAVLLGLVFGNLANISNPVERVQRTVNLELLLAISCFWLGCNAAAKELVKERVIFHRERDFNLRVSAYFASKLLLLAAIGIVQAALLWGIVQALCRLPGSPALQWLTLSTLAVAGTTIGLLISAIARSEELATALVPIVVIPQIILAGAIAPLNGLTRWVAQGFVSVYWAQQALEQLLPQADLTLLGKTNGNWRRPLAIVLTHMVVSVVLAVVVLLRSEDKTQ